MDQLKLWKQIRNKVVFHVDIYIRYERNYAKSSLHLSIQNNSNYESP